MLVGKQGLFLKNGKIYQSCVQAVVCTIVKHGDLMLWIRCRLMFFRTGWVLL